MARLLLNPRAGRARLAERLRRLADVSVEIPRSPAELAERARQTAEEGQERLLVAGGDGTLHHAIRGLARTDCALGIVPLGSGNDMARALGVPRDPLQAVRRALTAPVRRIDLGSVNGRIFAGVAGVGFDGEVASFASSRLRKFRGSWIYPYAVARTLMAYQPPRVHIEFDGRALDARVMLAAAANSPYFGGGMKIAPEALLDDGQLDLVVVEHLSRVRFLAAFPQVYRGRHATHPAVRMVKVRRATVRADPAVVVYADGEPLCECDEGGSRIEVVRGGLRVAA